MHHCLKAAVRPVAVPDADGIEDVSEDPGESEQLDPASAEIDTGVAQEALSPPAQRGAVVGPVIGGSQREEVKPFEREQTKPSIQLR